MALALGSWVECCLVATQTYDYDLEITDTRISLKEKYMRN